MASKITKQEESDIINLYQEGKSTKEVSTQLNFKEVRLIKEFIGMKLASFEQLGFPFLTNLTT